MSSTEQYRSLQATEIVKTIAQLHRRIEERFPTSRLFQICGHLLSIGEQAQEKTELMQRPIYWLRLSSYLFAAVVVGGFLLVVSRSPMPKTIDLLQLAQLLESGINDFIFLGAGLFFLITAETRIKRRRALRAIDELRAMAHLIDMQQLTKDPQRLVYVGKDTPSSPKEKIGTFELSRYLDYCSEMLALTGKIGALYATRFSDPVVLAAVNEIEMFTAAVSNKIWQKLTIINTMSRADLSQRAPV